jgi:hypothetical protein
MAASGGPVLRVIAADELGYVRCGQAAGPDTAALAAMQLVARWGDGARARGVERMALTDGDDESLQALLAGASLRGKASSRHRWHASRLRSAAQRIAATLARLQ